jgi:hypothetical protein
MEVSGAAGVSLRERNVPRDQWRAYRVRADAVLSGHPLPATGAAAVGAKSTEAASSGSLSADGDTIRFAEDRLRVWPEVPVPPGIPAPPVEKREPRYPSVGGRWVTLLEAGYQRNFSSFRDFFTDMLTFGVYFGKTLSDHIMPYFAFDVGFGDITDDMEKIAGDGRANTYNFSLGVLVRAEAGRRSALYLSGAGGYFVRSLQWGGAYEDPLTGRVSEGFVLEQQNFGVAVRAGIQFQTDHPRRLRAWDLGITLRMTPAERWAFAYEDTQVFGDLRDTWVALTIRFWDTI